MIKFHIYFKFTFNALKFCICFDSYIFCCKSVHNFLLISKKSWIQSGNNKIISKIGKNCFINDNFKVKY